MRQIGMLLYATGYIGAVCLLAGEHRYDTDLLLWLGAVGPLLVAHRSFSILMEFITIALTWLVLVSHLPAGGLSWYLPLVCAMLAVIGYWSQSRLFIGIYSAAIVLASTAAFGENPWEHAIAILCGLTALPLLTMITHTTPHTLGKNKCPFSLYLGWYNLYI
ncbi:hypothetical protein SPSIL_044260 [Sporomusa silvacetica DSM 10669]|uniref:Glycosyltransferase RgtA/B/C/D-like domain-containing protein n=1 Tax=Sporomusa silvacetica DSM 10669 TaxID=1123289 RepID=A0ABZ3IRK7_9FIRM|nr:hypothetical protein [Sporomusa silvacetica]OZC20687.1 hypothetical protein SPSIL_15550 [Sporomusa silvacetica DSM 10669]